jgi:hypothetical protein
VADGIFNSLAIHLHPAALRVESFAVFLIKISYLILKLVNILEEFGKKLTDKPQYLQANMNQFISYIHWLDHILLS